MIPNNSHNNQSERKFEIAMDDDGGVDDGPVVASAARLVDDELELESETKTGQAKLSRKRTKTGCLTCRRRRIKCGEERPTCGNCVKSKRQCEGYNQRVIFKDPLSTTYRAQSSNTQNNTPSGARGASKVPSASQQGHFHTFNSGPKTSLSNITEIQNPSSQRPGSIGSFPLADLSEQSGKPGELGDRQIYDFPPNQGGYTGTDSGASRHNTLADVNHTTTETIYLSQSPKVLEKQAPNNPSAHYDFSSLSTKNSKSGPTIDKTTHLDRSGSSSCVPKPPLQDLVYHSDIREAASAILTQSYQGSAEWPLFFTRLNSIPPVSSSHFQSRSTSMAPDHTMSQGAEERSWGGEFSAEKTSREIPQHQDEQGLGPDEQIAQGALSSSEVQPQHPQLLGIEDQRPLLNSSLENQNAETPCYLVKDLSDKSDEEMRLDESDRDSLPDFAEVQEDHLKTNDLGIVVALQASQDMQEPRLRTYHSYLGGPNILTSYQPSARSSPLTDSTTARIFYHYVNVTGPSISIYERHPANPSLMFQGRPIPRSQQHIWAYTMPTLALNNQALLHAMLAIGSLHVALLQDGPRMPTLKHYHIAIRRVAKSVRLPLRRGQPAILAATLLLGWYELMSGEHQKWSSHLLGATQLLKEIDFAGITTYLKNRKMKQRQERYGTLYHHEMALGRFEGQYEKQVESSEAPKQDDLNEGLIGMITGKKLRYDEFGQVMEDADDSGNRQKVYSQRELETYETQRDLFWWYCKQDAFQSILSGNRLFLPYDWWSHCPPRAAVGKRDATYGTFDHLILLLGRLAEFAAKDLKRKKIALQLNGAQWRPPSITPTQPGPEGQNAARQSRPPQMPSFVGMMPGTEGKAKLPRGFSPPREDSPTSDDNNPSLEDWTLEAEEEWHEIHTAFNILEENFGPDFQPLGPEHCQLIESPFGPALQYRTYSIAGIWIVYYMGLILCHRYHPTMPPAATMAAGIAARQTGSFANEIGRISAAIAPHSSQMAQVSTGVGAGLIECTFGLFIAGVQYQNPAQRSWLVQRCFDTIRLTGWQTAGAVAMGCESAWTKTAELGHGPPYKRVTEKKIDQEAWYNTRRAPDPFSPGARDREKIFIARADRVHYALGLLGVEQSLEDLDFDDDSKAVLK